MSYLTGPEFVSPEDLARYLRITIDNDDETAMERAYEAIQSGMDAVMAVLRVDSLEEREVVETLRLRVPNHVVLLGEGPVVGLTSVTQDGVEKTDDIAVRAWSLKSFVPFYASVDIVVTYTVGYRVDSDGTTTLPDKMRRAILMAAGDFYQTPQTRMKRERIGDYEYERGDAGGADQGRMDPIEKLLLTWLRY